VIPASRGVLAIGVGVLFAPGEREQYMEPVVMKRKELPEFA
jgi:hypothetical protein